MTSKHFCDVRTSTCCLALMAIAPAAASGFCDLSLKRMAAELFGKKAGLSGGRGGHMHLYDNKVNSGSHPALPAAAATCRGASSRCR